MAIQEKIDISKIFDLASLYEGEKDLSIPFDRAISVGVSSEIAQLYSEAVFAVSEGEALTPEMKKLYDEIRAKIDAAWDKQLSQ